MLIYCKDKKIDKLINHNGGYKNKGNALFLILIAVALFATLSYAVTQSGRGSGNVDREQKILAASEILQYAASVDQAIMRLQIINGCGDNEISFENINEPGLYINLNAPIDKSCNIFDQVGGGIRWQASPSEIRLDASLGQYKFKTGTTSLNLNGIGVAGNGDLWLVITNSPNFGKTGARFVEVCREINKKLGNPIFAGGLGDAPRIISSSPVFNSFIGSYIDGTTSMSITGLPIGTTQFCVEGPSSNYMNYYHLLIAR